jgi:hypothetical protein
MALLVFILFTRTLLCGYQRCNVRELRKNRDDATGPVACVSLGDSTLKGRARATQVEGYRIPLIARSNE